MKNHVTGCSNTIYSFIQYVLACIFFRVQKLHLTEVIPWEIQTYYIFKDKYLKYVTKSFSVTGNISTYR